MRPVRVRLAVCANAALLQGLIQMALLEKRAHSVEVTDRSKRSTTGFVRAICSIEAAVARFKC
jgi:hypothetical protein